MALLNARDEQWCSSLHKELPSLISFSYKFVRNDVQAERIVSECFLKLITKYTPFDTGKFPTVQHAKAFLCMMVRNKSLDYLKNKGRVPDSVTPVEEEEMEDIDTGDLVHLLEQSEKIEMVLDRLTHLKAGSQKVIRLILEGLKADEIAQQLGITPKKVSKLKCEAVKYLRQTIGSKQLPVKPGILTLLTITIETLLS